MPSPSQDNAQTLEQELQWFTQVLDTSFKLYFGQESEFQRVSDIPPPSLHPTGSAYARIVLHHQMTFAERLCFILALVPHIRPRMLDIFYTKNKTFDRKFTEFGGIRLGADGDFFPTGETLIFLLAGQDLALRFTLQGLFERSHFFTQHNMLVLDPPEAGLHPMKAPLRLSEEYLSYCTSGEAHRPRFSLHFPAHYLETQLSWEDLILHPGTLAMVKEIESWIKHGETLLHDWQMAGKIRPGYRALFYGPPGTGKTMTACLLGKATGYDVYRIDLSTLVSKYIGETEKNLSRVFDKAENNNWILFFDEADAIFGKRSETKDAHDRYANQEVSYLLQRIETYKGIAILASNLKENMDQAFARRFESIVYFPLPGAKERLRLWQKGFSPKANLERAIDLKNIAGTYELSGGDIMNVIRFVSLQAIEHGDGIVTGTSILQGIKREFAKAGRMS
jgi:hypothetical protein